MRILFIDDESRRMKLHVGALRDHGHDVTFENDVDAALMILETSGQLFDLVVLDISMPPGKAFASEDTVGGARTGLVFYERLRNLYPFIKVIILTNVGDRGISEDFATWDRNLCRFVRKPDVLPFQFAKLVDEFLSFAEPNLLN